MHHRAGLAHLALLMLVGLISSSHAAPARLPAITLREWRLGNGLRVVAGQELTTLSLKPCEEARSPLIAMLFWQGDDLARALLPGEIPLGILTALSGAAIFIALLSGFFSEGKRRRTSTAFLRLPMMCRAAGRTPRSSNREA